jgi:TatD DNase family protein
MQDAHLHLQDPRFQDVHAIIAEMREAGVNRCVVNGTSPDDWDRVKSLAEGYPDLIIPSYGLHPWKVPCEHDWKPLLRQYLEDAEIPCIGECGLDRWMKDFDVEAQQDAFLYQLDLACEMNAPLSIHILKAWGWFMEILRARKVSNKLFPERGFLLHSYNGSAELIPELVEYGAYFSFSGYYLNKLKNNELNTFTRVPIKRLLFETDAPDMLPPEEVITHPFTSDRKDSDTETAINHPANLRSIFSHFANHTHQDPPELEVQISENFSRFFLANHH